MGENQLNEKRGKKRRHVYKKSLSRGDIIVQRPISGGLRRESRAAVEDEVQVRGISHGRRSFGAYSSREEEWTPESFSSVIRDGASCKNPLDPRGPWSPCVLSPRGKDIVRAHRRRGGQIFFYILDPSRSFFYEPFFPAPFSRPKEPRVPFATRRGPFAQLSPFASSCLLFLSGRRKRIALNLLRLRTWECEHAYVLHALPIHGRTDAPSWESSAVASLSCRVFLPISRGQRITRIRDVLSLRPRD